MRLDTGQTMTPIERDYARKRGISIRSGKGPGKDAAIAIVVFWFLLLYVESKIFLVAPSLSAIKTNLIAEMSKWLNRTSQGEPVCILKNEYDLLSTGCRISRDEAQGKNWFATAMSAGPNMPEDKQLETLQGKHARFMMFVIDEASGVPDPVFQPLDTTLTDPVNFIILIWNPTRRSGFAYETHFGDEKRYWINLHWNAEESSIVSPEQITYLKDKYGESSAEYMVSVRGEPPPLEDGSLIPYTWCSAATELIFDQQETDPVIMGVDVARFGKDSSVILVRRGRTVVEVRELQNVDTTQLADEILVTAADYEPDAIYIDVAGIGIGVFDELRRRKIRNVHGVNVGKPARDEGKFNRLRDEYWWKLRQLFQNNEISLAPVRTDRQLVAELSSIRYDVNDKSKIRVESKLSMKKRNVPSPNKADALMLTMAGSLIAQHYSKKDKKLDKYERERRKRPKVLGWLGV